jgi:hypothetical protein
MISALANKTDGGSSAILWNDLSLLKSVTTAQSYKDILRVDFNTLNDTNYQNGLWTSWGTLGTGVSSAYATFSFISSGQSSSSTLTWYQNITSELHETGSFQQVNATFKQVNLSLNIKNENKLALAQSFIFSYQNGTNWNNAISPTIIDHGDGSYLATFYAESPTIVTPLNVSVKSIDTRGITIGANITCSS